MREKAERPAKRKLTRAERKQIEAVIRKAGGRTLETVRLFDVYRGAQIEAGKKSVAYSLTFRSPDKTLTDADIDPAVRRICADLEEKGCQLRT